jgi:hypothetical protein
MHRVVVQVQGVGGDTANLLADLGIGGRGHIVAAGRERWGRIQIVQRAGELGQVSEIVISDVDRDR